MSVKTDAPRHASLMDRTEVDNAKELNTHDHLRQRNQALEILLVELYRGAQDAVEYVFLVEVSPVS